MQSNNLGQIAARYGVGLKEHNGDYLPDDILLKHPGLGITAMNVAPAYGTIETRAYLKLHEVEADLARITSYNVCYTKLLRCRWK